MAISGDYSQPVMVNGFSCKNCADVDYAKKHVDPAHPKDGPYGVNANSLDRSKRSTAVSFGGGLAHLNDMVAQAPNPNGPAQPRLDIFI